LKIAKRKLTVKGIAEYLPSEINLNITELGVGDSIKVNDLNAIYPNLEFLDPQSVIVMIDVTRATKSETEAESKAETTTKTA
jgi:large subunit ribosomal protein L25